MSTHHEGANDRRFQALDHVFLPMLLHGIGREHGVKQKPSIGCNFKRTIGHLCSQSSPTQNIKGFLRRRCWKPSFNLFFFLNLGLLLFDGMPYPFCHHFHPSKHLSVLCIFVKCPHNMEPQKTQKLTLHFQLYIVAIRSPHPPKTRYLNCSPIFLSSF